MPKIIGGSLSEHRLQTRRLVFEAFARLMDQRSFAEITMGDIAKEAGVGRPALYNHFRDKEALVVAFATDETDRYVAELAQATAAVEGPEEVLRTYIRRHIALQDEFHFGMGPALSGILSREGLVEIRSHIEVIESVLAGIVTEGVNAGVFTIDDLGATLQLIHASLSPRKIPAQYVESFILRALGVH